MTQRKYVLLWYSGIVSNKMVSCNLLVKQFIIITIYNTYTYNTPLKGHLHGRFKAMLEKLSGWMVFFFQILPDSFKITEYQHF